MPSPPFVPTLVSIHFPLSRPPGEGAGGGFPSLLPAVFAGCSCSGRAVSGPLEPRPCLLTGVALGWQAVTAGEQRQAAAGQGRVCFCAGHKGRSPRGTKRVKIVSVKALGLAGARQAPFPGWCFAGSPRSRLGAFCLLYSSQGTSPLSGAQ